MLTTTVVFPDMMRGGILPMKDKDTLCHYNLFHEIPDMKASPQIRIVLVSYAVDHAARLLTCPLCQKYRKTRIAEIQVLAAL